MVSHEEVPDCFVQFVSFPNYASFKDNFVKIKISRLSRLHDNNPEMKKTKMIVTCRVIAMLKLTGGSMSGIRGCSHRLSPVTELK